MGMVVRSNLMAMNANRQLGVNNTQVGKSLEKLASGFRINRAGDDASGLAISQKMQAQIKGLDMASANAQDGISLIQTAEGALTEVHDMLERMSELAVKASNGTLQTTSGNDTDKIKKEIEQLTKEIDRIADNTKFNGVSLLNVGGSVTLQIGATASETLQVTLTSLKSSDLTLSNIATSIATGGTSAAGAIAMITAAINKVSEQRALFGALQNRLEHTVNNLNVTSENLSSANSRIKDTDMAKEMMSYTKMNVLTQAAQAMLAQANQQPQGVLQLLQ